MFGIKIDLSKTYDIDTVSEDFLKYTFRTIIKGEIDEVMGVYLFTNYNQFVPDVFNLGFGPIKVDGTLDDKINICHLDYSKVFSTILLCALTFLENNKEKFVGIDGSNKIRAYLFYRVLQNNYDYLIGLFRLIGVKYYLRLLRGPTNTDPFLADFGDLATTPTLITKGLHMTCDNLFNYFMFNLQAQII